MNKRKYITADEHIRMRIESAKQMMRDLKRNDPKKFLELRKANIRNRMKGKKKNLIIDSVAREE